MVCPGRRRIVNGDGPQSTDYARWVMQAEQAARLGGEYALANRCRRAEVNLRTHHDVKLQMDLETQQMIQRFLREVAPEHAFMGEEGGELDSEIPGQWIVDPIDGTMNYFQGIPHWCSSVALYWHGRPAAGAVFAPETGECFTAAADGPARLNGKPIRVADTDTLYDAAVLTGGLSRAAERETDRAAGLLRLLREVGKVRVLGAAALDACYVACGRADAFCEGYLHLWDMAAGGLIVERAGGSTLVYDVVSPVVFGFLASNGRLEEAMVEMLGIHPASPD
jgi:myo-inositol-1(or 4)-monophosphatase